MGPWSEHFDAVLSAHLRNSCRVELRGFWENGCRGRLAHCGYESLELCRSGHLKYPGGLGSDLKGVRKPPRQTPHRARAVHGLNVAAGDPQLAIDDVEEFVLDVVAMNRPGRSFAGARNSIAVTAPSDCSLLIFAV